jgi:glutamyl-Q tRNA(Asp) synthetase
VSAPVPIAAVPATRFAPSPNGRLHVGHALSALAGFDVAAELGGRFLLRIEDIDPARTREAHVAAILDDLGWLGLAWEQPVLRQSEHLAVYRAAADRLAAEGLLYPCFATRTEIAAAAVPGACDPDGAPLYPGLCKGLPPAEIAAREAAGEPFALRLDMDRALAAAGARLAGRPLTFREVDARGRPGAIREARPERWGDAVIVRKDTPTSYHLAVVVDDARQGITHVTRGRDLLAATDLHRLLQVLLDLPEPLYHHHALIVGCDGRKLAKSLGAEPLAALRQRKVAPVRVCAALRQALATVNEQFIFSL